MPADETAPIPKPKRPNRPVQQRAELREKEIRAIELAALGWRQQRIADELGMTRSGVSKMLHRTEQKLHELLRDRGAQIKARQTLFLEVVYREAMAAWEDSKKDAEAEKITTGDSGHKTETTRREQSGDPRFLDQARGALADIRRIWGLDEQQNEHHGTTVKIVVDFRDDFFATGSHMIDVPPAVEAGGPDADLALADPGTDGEALSLADERETQDAATS